MKFTPFFLHRQQANNKHLTFIGEGVKAKSSTHCIGNTRAREIGGRLTKPFSIALLFCAFYRLRQGKERPKLGRMPQNA
ncbi:MAG: hypothetical protein D8B56_00725 [Alloprevotella sp.]|nr:MAG: hypothetical protein D8B56_00725 [Alloprevotella sp.]